MVSSVYASSNICSAPFPGLTIYPGKYPTLPAALVSALWLSNENDNESFSSPAVCLSIQCRFIIAAHVKQRDHYTANVRPSLSGRLTQIHAATNRGDETSASCDARRAPRHGVVPPAPHHRCTPARSRPRSFAVTPQRRARQASSCHARTPRQPGRSQLSRAPSSTAPEARPRSYPQRPYDSASERKSP